MMLQLKIPTGTAGRRRVPNERPVECSNYSIELQIATEFLSKEIVVVLGRSLSRNRHVAWEGISRFSGAFRRIPPHFELWVSDV